MCQQLDDGLHQLCCVIVNVLEIVEVVEESHRPGLVAPWEDVREGGGHDGLKAAGSCGTVRCTLGWS